jgi:predicted dehydrogenase
MLHKGKINRRGFMKGVGGAVAAGLSLPYLLTSISFGETGTVLPSEQITLGFIGVGMQGRGLLWGFLNQPACRVVAICDVDENKMKMAAGIVDENYAQQNGVTKAAGCAGYRDFREVLARKDIDAVVIATPDNWHSVISAEACKAGKDVYCEKAMALTVVEARQVVNAVKRSGCVFQTGSMQRSDWKFRQACELVCNGYIGQLKNVRLCIGTGSFPMFPVACGLPAVRVPEYLDWDMWLGPAPWRPYNPRIAPPIEVQEWAHWRDYEDYAGGLMTDWGAHHFDIAQWGIGADDSGPAEIYPADGKEFKTLTYRYSNGVTVVRDDNMRSRSILFTGTDGTIEVSREFIDAKPQSLLREHIGPDKIHLYKSQNHYSNWLECIRSRQRAICDAEVGCRSGTVCHLGIIATRLGRPLKWDPTAERFINDAEADRMLSRPMRSPWIL